MSGSALIAAKKRVESSLKKFEIPTQENPENVDDCNNGSLYLSLLQSRLNWSTTVFIKYKADTEQQPRRAITTRKKWPNMAYLGSCTLQLGPHVFEDTNFYETIRSEAWTDIIEAHQGVRPAKKLKRGANKLERQGSMDTVETQEKSKTNNSSPVSNTEEAADMNNLQGNSSEEKTVDDIQLDTVQSDTPSPQHMLKWKDIVFELKEVPSERYIFPKESLISIESNSLELRASFALPLNPEMADDFFDTPLNKILKYGKTCDIEYVKNIAEDTKPKLPFEQYEPANILLSNVNTKIIEALEKTVYDPKEVKETLNLKAKKFPQKRYIQYSNEDKKSDTTALLNRVLHMPDLVTGPIMAEKKRNEILNAIKLGKRERDEKFEADLPKTKLPGVRDETILRCAYCATKYTTMWRPGPGGHGSLCNSCGLQWKRGMILHGAQTIGLKEERKLLKEKRERERQTEALEMERMEKDSKKHQKKQERNTVDMTFLDPRGIRTDSMNHFAAQLIQQRQNKTKHTTVHSENKLMPECSEKSISTPHVLTATNVQSYSLYSSGGIPLPTLSIDFGDTLTFSHPNCGITLLDNFFSIRLCKEGYEPLLVQFDKRELVDSVFNVLNEGDVQSPREVLRMTVSTELPKTIIAYETTAIVNKQQPLVIRFLEKLDQSGGAVVQRILQRWLVTFPQE